jgi:plasmid stabilization system protein ParE
MKILRHPGLAADINETARHYAGISEQVLSGFWTELDSVLNSISRNPRSHHFDACGLRRASFRRYPYHLLYAVEEDLIFLVVLRHDRRHPDYGMERRIESP